jgi:hypothetical protein
MINGIPHDLPNGRYDPVICQILCPKNYSRCDLMTKMHCPERSHLPACRHAIRLPIQRVALFETSGLGQDLPNDEIDQGSDEAGIARTRTGVLPRNSDWAICGFNSRWAALPPRSGGQLQAYEWIATGTSSTVGLFTGRDDLGV